MSTENKLTIEEAKKQGYKYATEENGEGQLIPLDKCTKGIAYLLVSKDGYPFTISDDTVKDLVDDYISNQDEVGDEDGRLNEIAATVNYGEITKKLNDAFSVTKYFYATDIKLVTPSNT